MQCLGDVFDDVLQNAKQCANDVNEVDIYIEGSPSPPHFFQHNLTEYYSGNSSCICGGRLHPIIKVMLI